MIPQRINRWLASLQPIADLANQYFNGDVEACRQQAIKYESLVVVGMNSDLYVDRFHFHRFLYADQADSVASRPTKQLDLVSGEEMASDLQKAARHNQAEMYHLLSRISEFERKELLETDAEERKLLSNAIVELKVKHSVAARAMHEAERKLRVFMTEYGSKPENIRPNHEATGRGEAARDSEGRAAEKPKRTRKPAGIAQATRIKQVTKKPTKKKGRG